MTAEICVMNSMGIAMAADSAMTIGSGRKIYNSANKLFTLSKFHPVGTMVYGNANFVRIPWESIIKVFRNNLDQKSFDTLKGYSDSFMDFLKSSPFNEFTDISQEENYVFSTLSNYYEHIAEEIIDSLKDKVNEAPEKVDEAILIHTANSKIEELLQKYDGINFIENFGDEDIRYLLNQYNTILTKMIENIFENLIFSTDLITNLSYIGVNYLLKEFSPARSGIVIAGFGEKEIYPTLFSFFIDGIINGKIKASLHEHEEIGFNCDASIIPFAQSDMAHTFIRGIDPDFEQFSNSYLESIFSLLPNTLLAELKSVLPNDYDLIESVRKNLIEELAKINHNYNDVINNYKQANFTNPILNVVRSLPKDELADIAEALVNLTSFRRKVSQSPETVGGPIDVAVITKGDGMVWIKRKHYFDQSINQQFIQKYFGREIK